MIRPTQLRPMAVLPARKSLEQSFITHANRESDHLGFRHRSPSSRDGALQHLASYTLCTVICKSSFKHSGCCQHLPKAIFYPSR
jgi:hypothetical protein